MMPMAKAGEEALGSMGTTRRWPFYRIARHSLFNYFKQLFAQVTKPPLDAIREELVTSMATAWAGAEPVLKPEAESCRMIKDSSPNNGQ